MVKYLSKSWFYYKLNDIVKENKWINIILISKIMKSLLKIEKDLLEYANHESLQDLLDKEERSLAEDGYDNAAV